MGDPDYQIALMLQRQFEEENKVLKEPKVNINDVYFAKQLQQQFEVEQSIDKKYNDLYYVDEKNKNRDNKKSLVDPSWELVDPTPNIFNLFMAFNER